jgi:putative ABC transport system ATP-binding protein
MIRSSRQTHIVLDHVWRQYRGIETVNALQDVSVAVAEGELLGIVGPSGSGKTTLLNLISGLDRPTQGEIRIAGYALNAMSEAELTHWRGRYIGMIFQFYNLIPVLSAVENVELPLILRRLSRAEQRERALHALRLVDLESRIHNMPAQLSGGQQQRVAIARAIVADPPILVADEPTGDLDGASSRRVLEILQFLAHERNKSVVVVTHDPAAIATMDRAIRIEKGLVEDGGARLSLVQ